MKADVLFYSILNMSITASLTIVMVLAARILLKKSRRFWSCLLWLPVLFRLLCPFSWKSPVSAAALIPAETMTIPSGSGNISMVSYAELLLRSAAENGDPADHGRICFSMEHSRNRIIHVLRCARRSDKRVAAAGAVIAVLFTAACASNPSAAVPA
ncbi:MAG: hypothetical protein ACI4WR_04280 [Bulleidia sp.]